MKRIFVTSILFLSAGHVSADEKSDFNECYQELKGAFTFDGDAIKACANGEDDFMSCLNIFVFGD